MQRVRRTARPSKTPGAFSLVELVIVVVIIGIVSSIAVPRISNASRGAQTAALSATLASVRTAIEAYYAEHQKYPGYIPKTTTPDDARFVDQLLLFSDVHGGTSATYGGTFVYGPYLRAPFPSNPINNLKTVKVKPTPGTADPLAGSVGWVAVLSHGYFGISATDAKLDDIGVKALDRAFLRTQ